MKKLILFSILLAGCQPYKSEETKRLENSLDSIRIEKGKTIKHLEQLQNG